MDAARAVLAGIIPGRNDRFLEAWSRLESVHFKSTELRNVFEILKRYFSTTGSVPSRRTFVDALKRYRSDTATAIYYSELWDQLEKETYEDDEFRWAIESLREQRAQQLTGEMLTNAFEALERGFKDEDGKEFKGHSDARKLLWQELAEIDRVGIEEHAPEGDIRMEMEDVHREYEDVKKGKGKSFVRTGIPTLDRDFGIHPSEMWLVCAYTGEGKSVLVTQMAWHAAVMEGKNVFFATAEMGRSQVRRRIIARHSKQPEFGLPEGLNSSAIKMGTLGEHEAKFFEVTDDLKNNPKYGRIWISQVPRAGSLGQVEARLRRAQSLWNVDLVVIDYLTLLRSDRQRKDPRAELNDILRETKAIATGFNSGKGVPIISPWPMSKDAWRRAQQSGRYEIADLGETSEAEKSSDLVLALLRLPEEPNEVKVQVLKNRDGDVPHPFVLKSDFKTSTLVEKQEATGIADMETMLRS